ncbi:hypothetical protein Tco_0284694 [Tanacetum coccineum]
MQKPWQLTQDHGLDNLLHKVSAALKRRRSPSHVASKHNPNLSSMHHCISENYRNLMEESISEQTPIGTDN